MKHYIGALLVLSTALAHAAVPSFEAKSAPEGWTLAKGTAAETNCLQSKDGSLLDLQTAAPMTVPIEAVFRFRVSPGDSVTVRAVKDGTNAVPLIDSLFTLGAGNQASVTARSSGEPMATDAKSSRTWSQPEKKSGSLQYRWRFPRVKNLWDDRDYREIGAAYARMTPFAEKVFTLRMEMTPSTRQVWLDERLVAEDRIATTNRVLWNIQLAKTARMLSADFAVPAESGRFMPLVIDRYSHLRQAQESRTEFSLVEFDSIPMRRPGKGILNIDLNDSLYRYRLTHGSGPDAGYVNGLCAWPNSFEVDPAVLSFRVPHRNYQNAWLLAWVDERPNTMPKGTLRFFRESAGYPASTDFEISDEAIRNGLVRKLQEKSAEGKDLYLIKVPVDTAGLYGMSDMADQFLEFEISKPVALGRSYPDPIYYGYHPAGLPSSIHVTAITMEEAPFGFQVEPGRTGYVFESPEKPFVTVRVTNTTAKGIKALVRMETTSYDGKEQHTVKDSVRIKPGQSGAVELKFGLKQFGWHDLKVQVEAEGVSRTAPLSLVLLPPNTRTYGNATNETRFGTWNLLGHYVPLDPDPASPRNDAMLAMFRRLGLRRFPLHASFVSTDLLKRHDFLSGGPHTVGGAFSGVGNDSSSDTAMVKAVASEVSSVTTGFADAFYFYGGEWHIGREVQYAPWPAYTGDGDRGLNEEEQANAGRHVRIFSAIGKALRAQRPGTRLTLQWGAPIGSIAYLRAGMPKELVDYFGMDAPMFELLPELPNITGSINQLWALRQEAAKLGWQRLPIAWCEGPFFPTQSGALTEDDQARYQVRYWLLGLAYGIEQFQAGVVPHDAGNYYGAEHYGAGLFHRRPLENPKPAVAATATATAMLCGSDVIGPVDTGSLTTYCLAFRRNRDKTMVYALWRVNGTADATIKVTDSGLAVTDSMGNKVPSPVRDGAITVSLSAAPIWLTSSKPVEGISLASPHYTETPAAITRPLASFTPDQWVYDGAEDKAYAYNHFAIRRIADSNLKAEFGQGEEGHADAVAIVLPVEPGDRPLATRHGQLKLKKPVTIPGKASALGVWIKGNSSWGRVVYECKDAKGEIWTSVGTKDDWNCDDTHAWSYVSFEGWRYVRFPLPGNHQWDCSRDLDITWWGSRNGDGIVDLPLALEKIIVEAHNEVPVLGEMKLVAERSYKLSGLVAEYDTEENTTDKPVIANKMRMPLPDWSGPVENLVARLAAEGVATAPAIKEFTEPQHFNDGRQMHIRFDPDPALTYNLYVGRYADGHGAELLRGGVKDNQLVTGLRPEMEMYLFLTAVDSGKKESKPSPAFRLVTHDNFSEK